MTAVRTPRYARSIDRARVVRVVVLLGAATKGTTFTGRRHYVAPPAPHGAAPRLNVTTASGGRVRLSGVRDHAADESRLPGWIAKLQTAKLL